jgi:hypothetical protein
VLQAGLRGRAAAEVEEVAVAMVEVEVVSSRNLDLAVLSATL